MPKKSTMYMFNKLRRNKKIELELTESEKVKQALELCRVIQGQMDECQKILDECVKVLK